MAKPVIIRVTQPITNISATLMDRLDVDGEAALESALLILSRGALTVSGSRTAVLI